MDELLVSISHNLLSQGPYVGLCVLAVWYLHNKLNKSEKARDDLNATIMNINKENAEASLKIAESQMATKAVIERLIDRLTYEPRRLTHEPRGRGHGD